MNFNSLASSSAGNAYILSDGETKLLLECGLTMKELKKRTGFCLNEIDACLITHEHKDHAKSVGGILDCGIPVYSSYGTAAALDEGRIRVIEERVPVWIGTFQVMAFHTFHDAAEPFGYLLQSTVDHEKILFATDTCNVACRTNHLNLIAVECNYDEEILNRSDHLPDKVKERIKNSHYEVNGTIRFLEELDTHFDGGLSDCRVIYLLHLSDACSDENKFKRLFSQKIHKKYPEISIVFCEK